MTEVKNSEASSGVKKMTFTFASASDAPGVVLFERASGRELARVPADHAHRIGHQYTMTVESYAPSKVSYAFYEGESIVPDVEAKAYLKSKPYGLKRAAGELRAIIPADYDWENDVNPKIPYEDVFVYCLHVRGFTMDESSGVVNRGTFAGIIEKIDYLKQLGVTTLELQPAYEFVELAGCEERTGTPMIVKKEKERLNYWGYTKGFYYAPKASYAAGEDASVEFKDLVKKLHENNMELVMQMYFPAGVNTLKIADILHSWTDEYHVDGFHLMGENMPAGLIALDPLLADTKLWFYDYNKEAIYGSSYSPKYRNLALYADHYYYDMRKFLKGDEGLLPALCFQIRHVPEAMGRIHYLSNYYGLTLTDSVKYNDKHNRANGEDNRDGNDYNASWNCGAEGETEDEEIRSLRLQRTKNAYILLMLSQSTPLIFMGDEFGNTQKGNNNPYCQDNEISYLNWNEIDNNREQYDFFREVVSLRAKHPVLHPAKEACMTDSMSCGYPGISFHGENAWRALYDHNRRFIGVMFCGYYAKKEDGRCDDFFYIGMNMHREAKLLALPKLPKGLKWNPVLETCDRNEGLSEDEAKKILEADKHLFARDADRMLNDIKAIEQRVLSAEKEKVLNALKEKAAIGSVQSVCCDTEAGVFSENQVQNDNASYIAADRAANDAPAITPSVFYDSELMMSVPGFSIAVYQSVPDEEYLKKNVGKVRKSKIDQNRQSF